MKNFVVVLKEQPSKDSVVKLIESFGGQWRINDARPELDEGVINDSNVFIVVDYWADIREGQGYQEEDIAELRERLGVEPRVALVFAVSRRKESSDTMAQRIAGEAIKRWGGVIDDDEL